MKIVKLAEVVKQLESGSRPKGGVSSETGKIPSLGAEHLSETGQIEFKNKKFVNEDFYKKLKNGKVIPNDILIVKDGATTGKVAIFSRSFPYKKVAINEHVFKISINEKIAYPLFIYCFLKSTYGKKQILNDFRGATVGGISRQFVDLVKIPLPPLDDQKRIAHLLDKVEGMIARRKQHLQQLDELLKSVFLEMFGDHASMKKQQHYSLGEYIEFLTSGSRGWAKYYADTGSVFLRINNVKEARLKLDDIVFVNAPNSAEATRTRVQAGDLLLSITADLGRTAVVSEEFDGSYINQHLALIRLKKGKGITPLFLAWYFYLPYGNSFIQKKNREGVKAGLNFDDIRSFNIIKPPITLQNKFAAIVEKVESLRSRYQSSLTNLENLYGVLSQKAFKGELDLSRVPMEVETR